MSKRPRDEEESATLVTETEPSQDDTSRAPIPKKLRIIQRVGPEVRAPLAGLTLKPLTGCLSDVVIAFPPQEEVLAEDSAEAEGVVPSDNDGAEASQVCKHHRHVHHARLFGFCLLLYASQRVS